MEGVVSEDGEEQYSWQDEDGEVQQKGEPAEKQPATRGRISLHLSSCASRNRAPRSAGDWRDGDQEHVPQRVAGHHTHQHCGYLRHGSASVSADKRFFLRVHPHLERIKQKLRACAYEKHACVKVSRPSLFLLEGVRGSCFLHVSLHCTGSLPSPSPSPSGDRLSGDTPTHQHGLALIGQRGETVAMEISRHQLPGLCGGGRLHRT